MLDPGGLEQLADWFATYARDGLWVSSRTGEVGGGDWYPPDGAEQVGWCFLGPPELARLLFGSELAAELFAELKRRPRRAVPGTILDLDP